MAAGAAHFALWDGVVRRALAFGPIRFVAGEACVGLGGGLEQGRLRLGGVDAMAGGAVHVATGVHAAEVTGLVDLLVAGQALLGFLKGKVGRLEGEDCRPAAFLEMPGRTGMAGHAARPAGRLVGIPGEPRDRLLVAAGTRLRPFLDLEGGTSRGQNGKAHEKSQASRHSEQESSRLLLSWS